MEAATIQSIQNVQEVEPDFSLNSNPALFLEGKNYLDIENPLDRLAADYKEVLDKDNFPTAVQQHALIRGLKGGDLQSARELVDSHMGLIAAVAYPFKFGKVSAEDLLREGTHAFVRAAKTYDREKHADFSDYAITVIHAAYGDWQPELAGSSFVELPQRPMESVYQFIRTLRVANTPEKIEEMQKRAWENERLEADELRVLPLLHLKAEDISLAIGAESVEEVHALVASIKEKLGVETREAAALIGLQRGIQYDVLDIPDRDYFTVDERLVAMRFGQRNPAIAKELGFSMWKVRTLSMSLWSKTNARTRAEIAIMAHMHDFEPAEEEINPPPPSLLERLNVSQKKVLPHILYMKDKDLVKRDDINMSVSGVKDLVHRTFEIAGVSNRTALVLELHRAGMEFDVAEPTGPVEEILYAHEIEIAKLLHLPYEEINELLQLNCTVERIGAMVLVARRKLGARSRQELALMVEMYYDESEALEITRETNEWSLAKQLGLRALGACNIDALIEEATTDRQGTFINDFYRSKRPAGGWREVAEKHDTTAHTARACARRGIIKMRRLLEEKSLV